MTELQITLYSGVPFNNKYKDVLFVSRETRETFLNNYSVGDNFAVNRFEIINDNETIVDNTTIVSNIIIRWMFRLRIMDVRIFSSSAEVRARGRRSKWRLAPLAMSSTSLKASKPASQTACNGPAFGSKRYPRANADRCLSKSLMKSCTDLRKAITCPAL